jgi:hypothetical protein
LAQDAELKDAFKRLRNSGNLKLWKYNGGSLWDYSDLKATDVNFFFTGPFGATITPEGRSRREELNVPDREGVFISHITFERPIALVLQKYIRFAFGDELPVFVSSDGKSIGGGKKWYDYILHNLRLTEVGLVLVSQESKSKEWINFEAGVGEGLDSLAGC